MLFSSLSKAARGSTSNPILLTISSRSPQVSVAASRPFSARTHQPRYSSSKASNPPNDDSRAIAATSEAPAAKDGTHTVKEEVGKKPATRLSRRKSKDASVETVEGVKDEALLNLPSVPSTHHLHPHDVHVASFFSIHRPISVTASIPPNSTPTAFSSIFLPRKPQPAEVIYTLSSAVQTLENASSRHPHGPPQPAQAHQKTTEEIDLRAAVTQASSSNAEPVKHLDGAPGQPLQINMQELLKNFRPFVPPPPPSPMGSLDVAELRDTDPAASRPTESGEIITKQKSYSTVLTLIENTHPSGRKSYNVRASPFQVTPNLPPSTASQGKLFQQLPTPSITVPHQKFLKRMRERQEEWEDFRDEYVRNKSLDRTRDRMVEQQKKSGDFRDPQVMWNEIGGYHTLSVKRQRKLKMKKHKYKKLMRRTRNLRRKLDRL